MGSQSTPEGERNRSRVDRRTVGTFLALAFGLSWTGAAVLFLAGVPLETLAGTVALVVVFMWAPAVAAIATRWWDGESIRAGCGLAVGRPRWVALAWLAPVALVGATVGVGVTLPGVAFTTDYATYLLEVGLSRDAVEATVSQLEALPVPPAVVLVLQGLLAGLTINALAALGEELGWRGLLLSELAPLGFWKLSTLTGAIWGIWHAPVIVQGYNFPNAPLSGVVVMTAATIALSPIYTYLTVRARSVLAATFLHGSFNGLASLSLVHLAGAGNLLIAPVGVAGVGAAVLGTVACVVHDRVVAAEPITTGEPLSPWT